MVRAETFDCRMGWTPNAFPWSSMTATSQVHSLLKNQLHLTYHQRDLLILPENAFAHSLPSACSFINPPQRKRQWVHLALRKHLGSRVLWTSRDLKKKISCSLASWVRWIVDMLENISSAPGLFCLHISSMLDLESSTPIQNIIKLIPGVVNLQVCLFFSSGDIDLHSKG